jgi:hypothetical protein
VICAGPRQPRYAQVEARSAKGTRCRGVQVVVQGSSGASVQTAASCGVGRHVETGLGAGKTRCRRITVVIGGACRADGARCAKGPGPSVRAGRTWLHRRETRRVREKETGRESVCMCVCVSHRGRESKDRVQHEAHVPHSLCCSCCPGRWCPRSSWHTPGRWWVSGQTSAAGQRGTGRCWHTRGR